MLAKSIAETEGMVWAWFIHSLQNVIFFYGLFLVALYAFDMLDEERYL